MYARIYVGCSLTNAPESFDVEVEALKGQLRQAGHEVLEFFGRSPGDPRDVYKTDIHDRVAKCEMSLAVCDWPSIGLGWELGTAVEKYRKPTLAVAKRTSVVTRFVFGAECELNLNFQFRRYDDMSEIVLMVASFLEEMKPQFV
jgi:hypothetical protein